MPKKSTSSELSKSKSSYIKAYLRKNPGASAQDVVAALAQEGIDVKSGLVYAVRSGMTQGSTSDAKARRKRGGKRRTASTVLSNGSPAVESERGAKARAIRDMYRRLGRRARPRDIQAALHEQGIEVSSSQVSTVLKQFKQRRRRRKEMVAAESAAPAAQPRREAESFSSDDLFDAKALSDRLGGLKEMRKVLDVLEKLT